MRIVFLLFFTLPLMLQAQLNMSQLGFLDIPDAHATKGNDVWGYEDEAGNEYAMVGTEDGVSVVDVTDPANPVELSWITGMNSIWRDIKVYDDYAYVTTEASQGLQIIDLSPLPGSSSLPVSTYNGPSGSEWLSAHNLYIDNGFLYIFGAGRGNGGVIILDVATDPLNPIEVGVFDNWYAHDGYVLNDTGYFAHIYDGFFSIVDLTDKSSPVLLGTASSPDLYCHNIWTTADGNYAFTTDEIAGGHLGAYNISDPANIQFLDKIRSSPTQSIVPHNTHVLGNYIITSYYTDGVLIHDVTHPHNMVEVGNFDTSPLSSSNTSGCWGVYPFLSSGNILATDREEGLFVLSVDYVQGAYLEGNITEQGSGNPLNDVEISLEGTTITDYSSVVGDYATGTINTGTVDVTYFKVLYYPQTISTILSTGNVLIQDVVLQKIPQYSVTVQVLEAQSLNPIENAQVSMNHTYINHEGVTDVNGEVVLDLYYQDYYDITAGKWGFVSECFMDSLVISSTGTIVIYLEEGIYDDFSLDFGWSVFGDAEKGMWEREKPVGIELNGVVEAPFYDSDWDCGEMAFLTGNGTQSPQTDDVYNGETVLMSPVFNLTAFTDPHINFSAFYYNLHGPFYPNDTLFFSLFNGSQTVNIAKIHKDNTVMNVWSNYSVPVNGLIPLTSNMQLIVRISDYPATLNITEAAFDYFFITDFSVSHLPEETKTEITFYPNPFYDQFTVSGILDGEIEVYDLSGRRLAQQKIGSQNDFSNLESGTYLFVFKDISGNIVATSKGIKQ
ncbi:MAG: choice-of-anchor B family protein [Crocinitomicaceae bacterium]